MKKKVLVGMSGGVDSTVTSILLQKEGYDVEGVYMKLHHKPGYHEENFAKAQRVGEYLGVKVHFLDLSEEFNDQVYNYFVESYKEGRTPNPCVMCNRNIKFGKMVEFADSIGADHVATGHYIKCDGEFIYMAEDPNKDQSYFLALLQQEQIRQVLFPLGAYKKAAVRKLAIQHKLPNAEKKDSQGICFLGDVPINRFLEHYIEDAPGNIVNSEGKILGQHKGLHRYTLGQRRWIGVPSNTDNEFYVVIGFNHRRNELIVGFDNPKSPGLFGSEFDIQGLSFINQPIQESCKILAKPRYRDPSQSITYHPTGPDTAKVIFDQPQRALASGQVIALYRGETLIGGGFYK